MPFTCLCASAIAALCMFCVTPPSLIALVLTSLWRVSRVGNTLLAGTLGIRLVRLVVGSTSDQSASRTATCHSRGTRGVQEGITICGSDRGRAPRLTGSRCVRPRAHVLARVRNPNNASSAHSARQAWALFAVLCYASSGWLTRTQSGNSVTRYLTHPHTTTPHHTH